MLPRLFSQDRQDSAGRPLGNARDQELLRVEQQAFRVVPGVTLVFAALLLMMGVASVVNGEFRLNWLLAPIPALAAAFLALYGRRRRRLGLCFAGIGVLILWGAGSAAVAG